MCFHASVDIRCISKSRSCLSVTIFSRIHFPLTFDYRSDTSTVRKLAARSTRILLSSVPRGSESPRIRGLVHISTRGSILTDVWLSVTCIAMLCASKNGESPKVSPVSLGPQRKPYMGSCIESIEKKYNFLCLFSGPRLLMYFVDIRNALRKPAVCSTWQKPLSGPTNRVLAKSLSRRGCAPRIRLLGGVFTKTIWIPLNCTCRPTKHIWPAGSKQALTDMLLKM